MTIPSYEELMPSVLDYAREERTVRDAVAHFADSLNLSEEERARTIPSGTKPLIRSRIEWAITYLVQAGLLDRPRRGHFKITAAGVGVLRAKPEKIDTNYLKRFPKFLDFVKGTSDATEKNAQNENAQTEPPLISTKLDPEELIGEAYRQIESDLKSQILARILKNSPEFFENTVVSLLSAMGYGGPGMLAEARGKAGDGGIDGVIYEDKLGLDIVYIQAKRYAPEHKVSRPELQAFVGTLVGVSAHKGVFVASSDFSPAALAYLNTVNSRIITINGQQLVNLMIEHAIGVKVKQKIEIHRIDEDFFIDE